LAAARRIGELQKAPIISIIDDDESIRVATESLVRSLGYSAVTFASADEFLKSPRMADTSCVISDVQMPNMSGLELQERLVAQGSRTPIIFITAFPDEGVRARAMNAGAICFLNKPFDMQALMKCLGEALKMSRG
jgi:FixJ family two-component response regulator